MLPLRPIAYADIIIAAPLMIRYYLLRRHYHYCRCFRYYYC